MMTPFFERDAQLIGDALAPTGTPVWTDVCDLGFQPSPNKGGPFAGAQVNYTFTQSGGATDSDLTIDTYLASNGAAGGTLDTGVYHTFTTSGATSAAAFVITKFFLACEPNYMGVGGEADEWYAPVGVAFKQKVTRADGDKTIVLNVNARRFWWAMSR